MNLSILQSEKIKKRSKIKKIDLFFVVLASLAIVFVWQLFPGAIALLLIIIAVWFFTNNITYAMYPIILTGFFHGWVINFSQYSLLQKIPLISAIDTPLVDLVAIIMGISFIFAVLLKKFSIKKVDINAILPGIYMYGGFILISFISAKWFMFNGYTEIGLKYVLRPITFVFLAYVVLPYLLLKDQKQQYLSIIKTMFWLAVAIALFGLSSLFVVSHMGWSRIVPYQIFGISPLGTNHNQLAEVLVALVPTAWYLYAFAKHKLEGEHASLYAFVAISIMTIATLTLSRAAWVALAVQACIAIFYLIRFHWFKVFLKDKSAFILVLFSPILAYMMFFLGSSIVTSSNVARVDAASIAYHYSKVSPWVGQGPGSFIYILADTAIFRAEYGDPLDSHGFILKMLLEQGIVGLILFVMFLLWVIGYVSNSFLHTKDRALVLMVLCSVSGIITFQLFDTSYYSSIMWLPIGLGLAMVTGVRRIKY